MQPVTQYDKSGSHPPIRIFGGVNVVMVPGFVSNVENYWDHSTLETERDSM